MQSQRDEAQRRTLELMAEVDALREEVRQLRIKLAPETLPPGAATEPPPPEQRSSSRASGIPQPSTPNHASSPAPGAAPTWPGHREPPRPMAATHAAALAQQHPTDPCIPAQSGGFAEGQVTSPGLRRSLDPSNRETPSVGTAPVASRPGVDTGRFGAEANTLPGSRPRPDAHHGPPPAGGGAGPHSQAGLHPHPAPHSAPEAAPPAEESSSPTASLPRRSLAKPPLRRKPDPANSPLGGYSLTGDPHGEDGDGDPT